MVAAAQGPETGRSAGVPGSRRDQPPRCPLLVGRDREVASLAETVELLVRSTGSVTVLAGEAGIGKTRLARHAASLALDAGAQTALGRAVPELSISPLRPVSEALMDLTRGCPAPDEEAVAPYVAVLASLVPRWRAPGWRPAEESPLVVAESLIRMLGYLAPRRGLLIVLEDLHWADAATVEVVRFLTDHIGEAPAAVVATVRTGEGRDEVARLLQSGGAQVCHLARLSDEQAALMASACVGDGALPDGRIERVVRNAEGLPLLVEDLLATDVPGTLPRRFGETVRARLNRLGPRERRVLAAAAILGRRFDWRAVAAVTGLAAEAVARSLDHGVALQLVVAQRDGYEFRHALTREVVLGELGVIDRQRLSLSAAETLAPSAEVLESPAEVLESPAGSADADRDMQVGRLLAEGGEPERAARVLHRAGRRALAGGSFAVAEAALRSAAAVASEDSPRGLEIGCDLARVLVLSGQPIAAGKLAARLAGLADGREPGLAGQLLLVQARAAVATGQWQEAYAHLGRARVTTGEMAAAAEMALLHALVALGDSRPGSRAGAEYQAAQAVAIARQAGRADLECEALEVMGLCARLRDLNAAAGALNRALRLAETAHLPVQRLHVLNELGTVEMLRDARGDRLEQARAEALRAGALGLAAAAGVNLAAALVMTARFQEAQTMAAEVGSLAARLGLVPLQAASELMQGFAAAHQGHRRDMDRHLAAAEALAPDDADLRAGAWGIGRGLLALLEEDGDGALRALTRARAEAPDQHARILNPYEGPELLLRAVAGEVTLAEAETAAAGVVRAARWPQLWAGTALAAARGVAGDREGAVTALADALDAGGRYPVFHALAARLAAEAASRDRWGDPVTLLRSAEWTFTRLRLTRAAAACQGLLRARGQSAPRRRRGDDNLPLALLRAGVTRREAEVLELVADRLTNREIAQRLYLSPRTVEKHVAALMMKLGAAERNALAQLARATPARQAQNGGELPMRSR